MRGGLILVKDIGRRFNSESAASLKKCHTSLLRINISSLEDYTLIIVNNTILLRSIQYIHSMGFCFMQDLNYDRLK